MKKAEGQLIAALVVVGLPIYALAQLGDSVGWVTLIVVAAAVIGLIGWYKAVQKKQRRSELMKKYQDSELVEKLMGGYFWEGQTSTQLMDALGKPQDIDQKVLKTKKKEVWKYDHQSGNRYGLRITLDDDVVVGWDKKT